MNNLLVSNNKYHITVLKLIYSHLVGETKRSKNITDFQLVLKESNNLINKNTPK